MMSQQRITTLWLIGCLLLAFGLRLYRLDGQSLWYDEAVTADLARRSLADLTHWTANDIQPPLYYYLVSGWGRVAGWSEWSLRFPSAWFGVLTVPLLAGLARRISTRPTAARWVALLAALHPLLVYYGQEARMYTLLLALGVLVIGFGLHLLAAQVSPRVVGGYLLAATAAIYTHYFAFFLLLTPIGFALLHHRPRLERLRKQPATQSVGIIASSASPFSWLHESTPLRRLLFANLAVLLLYLPWLGQMFRQLAVDRSYWQGEFKLSEGVRAVLISFTSGETMPETLGSWLLIPFGLLSLIALFRLIRAADPQNRHVLHLALLWLIIPVVGVLTLATFTPKFNARYALIALPGLLLLWGIGLTAPTSFPAARGSRMPKLVLAGGLGFLVIGALWSNANWFFDRAYTKDNWRDMALFLRGQLEPHETIILVSGHAAPAWTYYAPDLPIVRLPEIDVLDVDALLTFANTVEPLRAAFAPESGKNGVWLVKWQADIVDPTGIVPIQLELGGREKGLSTRFWGLDLQRFSRIRPERIVDAPPISTPLQVNFADQLGLQGVHLMENGDLLLFWQRLAPDAALAADYGISGETLLADGSPLLRLADRRPAVYTYPVARWGLHETVVGHIPATDWLGPEPAVGTYTLRLTVYRLEAGHPQTLITEDGQTTLDLPVTIEEFD